jgi:hypothetical protein
LQNNLGATIRIRFDLGIFIFERQAFPAVTPELLCERVPVRSAGDGVALVLVGGED